jgi:Flp pilus assembly protein TadB
MKKRTENQKVIRGLRAYFKESLFLPIFYTVIYGLGMIALIILPDYTLFQRITGGTLMFAILAINWVVYGFGKRTEKNTKQDIDELENSLELVEKNVDGAIDFIEVEEIKDQAHITEE